MFEAETTHRKSERNKTKMDFRVRKRIEFDQRNQNMNKRQRNKLDNKLTVAIRELNNDVAISEGLPLISGEEVQITLKRVKKSKASIIRTLKDYKRYILNG
jgi:hypothetical protein